MKEHFQLDHQDTVAPDSIGVQPGNVLVTVRDYNTMTHLKWVLERTDTDEQDVVVLTARLTGPGAGEFDLTSEQMFSDYEQLLFTKAVSVAEGVGKTISLIVVPARDPFSAIVQTANTLESAAIVAGLSTKMSGAEQAFRLGQAWEAMPDPKRQIVFQVVHPNFEVETFRIGPHTPTMKTEDVHLVHRMWLRMRRSANMDDLHHSDIVTLALTRLALDYSRDSDEVNRQLRKGFGRTSGSLARPTEPATLADGSTPPAPPPSSPPKNPKKGFQGF